MAISVPSSVLASGWVPFVVVILIILVISTIYIKYYNSRRDGECSSTLGAIFALSISMMTTALIPVDIFLVSFMKDSNGTFKDWATDNSTRDSVESSVMAGYYTMYGLVTFCMFLLLPFMYFYYEERDEEEQPSWKSDPKSLKKEIFNPFPHDKILDQTKLTAFVEDKLNRCCGAMKYMIVFLIMIFVLLLIGALVHTKPIPNASNSTQFEKMKALFDMESNWLENSLSLVISILSLIGMVTLFVYTAYGMAALPIGLIKGHRNIKREKLQVQSRKSETQERIAAIREKYSRGKKMSRRDAREISDLEESEALMKRQERHLVARDTCCQKCWLIFRPFGIIIGIALILIAILVFLSLLFANIDKAMNGAGLKFGYTLSKKSTLPNPVDIMLVFCQKVFPLDYIMFALLVFYFVFCSMSGLRNIGIWFFWLRMYRIRPGRTAPQGMMMMCMILMFITLAINIIMYELTPQYSAYGSQHFWNHTSNQLEVCSTKNTQDECVMTRMALLLTRFFYKMWIFGAAYYWGTWAFLFFILLGFVVAICKKSKSAIDGEVDADDIVDSDEELIDG